MSPWDQRADDDCLVCCLSYMLGVPYEGIPQFVRDHGPAWNEELREWLASRGLEVVAFDNHYPRAGIYMADGWTNRDTAHMTVWRGVEMIHDPHESRAGLDNIRRTYWVMPRTLCDSGGQPKAEDPASGLSGEAMPERPNEDSASPELSRPNPLDHNGDVEHE